MTLPGGVSSRNNHECRLECGREREEKNWLS